MGDVGRDRESVSELVDRLLSQEADADGQCEALLRGLMRDPAAFRRQLIRLVNVGSDRSWIAAALLVVLDQRTPEVRDVSFVKSVRVLQGVLREEGDASSSKRIKICGILAGGPLPEELVSDVLGLLSRGDDRLALASAMTLTRAPITSATHIEKLGAALLQQDVRAAAYAGCVFLVYRVRVDDAKAAIGKALAVERVAEQDSLIHFLGHLADRALPVREELLALLNRRKRAQQGCAAVIEARRFRLSCG